MSDSFGRQLTLPPSLPAEVCDALDDFVDDARADDGSVFDVLRDLEGEPDPQQQLDALLAMLADIREVTLDLGGAPMESLRQVADDLGIDPDDNELLFAVLDKLIGEKLEDVVTQVQDTALETLLRAVGLSPGSASRFLDSLRNARSLNGHLLLNLYVTAVEELLEVLTEKIRSLQIDLQIADPEERARARRRLPSPDTIGEPWRRSCDPSRWRTPYEDPSARLPTLIPDPEGRSKGEPHLSTYDGLEYDFQLAGEFVVTESTSDDFEVQARYVPRRDVVSVTAALAMLVEGTRIGLYLEDQVADEPAYARVDGSLTPITTEPIRLPGGGVIVASEDSFDGRMFVYVQASDATTIQMQIGFADVINWQVHPAPGRSAALAGLFGDFDDNPGDDLRLRDGPALPASPTSDQIEALGRSWRVDQASSLFEYAPGQTTDTFTIEDFPRRNVTAADLTPADRAAAERVCLDAGVTGDPDLDWCIFDVALTGNAEFAIDAADDFIDPPRIDTFTVEVGTTVSQATAPGAGDIEEVGAVDVYNVNASSGDRLFVDVPATPPDDCDSNALRVAIIDPDGDEITRPFTWLLSNLCREGGHAFELVQSGVHQVVVNADPGAVARGLDPVASYRLELAARPVERFTVQLGEPIEPGRPAPGAGVIEARGDADLYQFEAEAGTSVTVDVDDVDGNGCDSTSALQFEILGPDGTEVTGRLSPNLTNVCERPREQGWTITRSGTYELLVRADPSSVELGNSPSGTYQLTIRVVD